MPYEWLILLSVVCNIRLPCFCSVYMCHQGYQTGYLYMYQASDAEVDASSGISSSLATSDRDLAARLGLAALSAHLMFFFARRRCAKYCDEYVYLSVCLSVCSHILKPHGRTSPNVLCMLLMAVVNSSSDGIAMHYVVPVLRMMSCFQAHCYV